MPLLMMMIYLLARWKMDLGLAATDASFLLYCYMLKMLESKMPLKMPMETNGAVETALSGHVPVLEHLPLEIGTAKGENVVDCSREWFGPVIMEGV